MPTTVASYTLEELALKESKNHLHLKIDKDTAISIEIVDGKTEIRFPYGNKFDTLKGRIIKVYKS